MKKLFLILFLLFSISGCARMLAWETPYDKTRWYDGVGGYEDEEISERVFKIKFSGNGVTPPEKIMSYWHRRARELCKGNYDADPKMVRRDIGPISMTGGGIIFTDAKLTIVTGIATCKPD